MVTFLFFNFNSSFTYGTFYFIVIKKKFFIFYKNMHKINVLSFGSKNFNISLEELKDYLNFNLTTINNGLEGIELKNHEILLIHEEYYKNNPTKIDIVSKNKNIKILAFNSSKVNFINVNEAISLPTSIKDLNQTIENSVIKKNFNKNSSIFIKKYILDKNEKKLIKDGNFILLTEKEIELLELLLNKPESISKNKILKEVWKYVAEADTHTVETHIYRLRKKIKSTFFDNDFILNDKNGYSLWQKEIK